MRFSGGVIVGRHAASYYINSKRIGGQEDESEKYKAKQ